MENVDIMIDNNQLINNDSQYIYEKSNKSEEIYNLLILLGEKQTIKWKSNMWDILIKKTNDKRIELYLSSKSWTIKFEATDPHFNETLLKMLISWFVPEINENIN